MAYNIYAVNLFYSKSDEYISMKLIKSFPTRDQAIAELYSRKAIFSEGMPNFITGVNEGHNRSYTSPKYTIIKTAE